MLRRKLSYALYIDVASVVSHDMALSFNCSQWIYRGGGEVHNLISNAAFIFRHKSGLMRSYASEDITDHPRTMHQFMELGLSFAIIEATRSPQKISRLTCIMHLFI